MKPLITIRDGRQEDSLKDQRYGTFNPATKSQFSIKYLSISHLLRYDRIYDALIAASGDVNAELLLVSKNGVLWFRTLYIGYGHPLNLFEYSHRKSAKDSCKKANVYRRKITEKLVETGLNKL